MFVKRHLYRSEDDNGGAPPPPAPPAPPTPPAPPPNDGGTPPAPPPSDPPPAPPAPPASKWSDTWREDMAGSLAENATAEEKADHEKLLKRLQRFNSPADAAKALREQDKLISSGTLKKALPSNPTEAQLKAWRAENGIPEAPDKYDTAMPDGLVFGEEDQPAVKQILADLHAANASNDQVKAALKSYANLKKAAGDAMAERNKVAKRALENELRSEWGGEYDDNVDAISSMLTQQGEDYSEFIFSLRKPDGTQAMNDPRFVRALAQEAREKGFMQGTVVPAGGDVGKSIEDQIAEIEKSMFNADGTKNSAYWGSEKQQTKYSKLLESRDRVKKRETA